MTHNHAANWLKINPNSVAWQQFEDPHGRPTTPVRILKEGAPYVLEADFPAHYTAGLHWHPHDTLYFVTQGELQVGDEGAYHRGDVRWVNAGHCYGPERAGPDGVRFFLVSLGGPIGLNWADLAPVPQQLASRLAEAGKPWGRASIHDAPWEDFVDAAGRPTQPVQVLANAGPYLLHTRFAPDFSAGEHWHEFDTLYFITEGSMRFGNEGWYSAGDIRWVRGGHSYGPEEPGPQGVSFFLVSCGGPVQIHWSDLEPPPTG